jgi:hypothetical protein
MHVAFWLPKLFEVSKADCVAECMSRQNAYKIGLKLCCPPEEMFGAVTAPISIAEMNEFSIARPELNTQSATELFCLSEKRTFRSFRKSVISAESGDTALGHDFPNISTDCTRDSSYCMGLPLCSNL